jgi:NitT/TauT family transport system substrate-binding protein
MTYRNSRFLGVLTAVTLTLGIAGCSAKADPPPEQAPEKPDLTVAVVPTVDCTGFYVALHEGLFAQQGLHITYQAVSSGERSVNGQALGKYDVLCGSYVSDIEAQVNYDEGVRATPILNPTVHQIAADLDFIALASVMQPGSVGLFTLPGSPIQTASDLRGKTIGINAPGNVAFLLLAEYLVANGVPPQSVHLKYFPFPDMTQALQAHDIDVAFLEEPYISTAEESVGVTELTDLDAGAAHALPMRGYTVTKQFARRYPRTVAAFLRALEAGQEIADTNRRAAELATEAFTGSVSPRIAAMMTFATYPVGSVDSVPIQRVADDMLSFGLLQESFNVQQMIGAQG